MHARVSGEGIKGQAGAYMTCDKGSSRAAMSCEKQAIGAGARTSAGRGDQGAGRRVHDL